ncbi:PhzF family phenazine biosynthesis protein [Dactylosporangium matsuzakiense]|uniref:Oxidoreductase n=1 Tax=Dactylosporangium matsuzakiense TaxID=53360 RepID=A0A9W6NPD3_9ACTN|nr:PhzF family phenazine biosynthesis protein [Dactylosporangium matsuzakiense]UWZ41991.1 PhzF family phenazine biosynthesis isomerase [Dactylosporangium matsuzakiense]GLL04930.1 oxidoreductase [Dactylosporangium matsuzakiense]
MDILRYAAFTDDPAGGNPAGVVLDATGLAAADMQRIAAEVGYSETAFLTPTGDRAADVRYFSPLAEVPFCGHATIATAVAYAERSGPGPIRLAAPVGQIAVDTADGSATLRTVAPATAPVDDAVLAQLLTALRYTREDLDPQLPVRAAFAGAWHPIVALRDRARLARLDYDVDALGALMAAHGWTTVDLVWRESALVFHARNPFPPGGVYEDPATGAAAAAFGGYLRELGLVPAPAELTIHQGHDLGRPSLLRVSLDADPGAGVRVTGRAVEIPA